MGRCAGATPEGRSTGLRQSRPKSSYARYIASTRSLGLEPSSSRAVRNDCFVIYQTQFPITAGKEITMVTVDDRRETVSLIGSDKVEGSAVYGRDAQKIGTVQRV